MSVNFSKHAKPYIGDSAFRSVLFFQKLLSNDPLGSWSSFLQQNELRFIYDMVSSSNSYRNFTLTTPQSQWLLKLMGKIEPGLSQPTNVTAPNAKLSDKPRKKKKNKRRSKKKTPLKLCSSH